MKIFTNILGQRECLKKTHAALKEFMSIHNDFMQYTRNMDNYDENIDELNEKIDRVFDQGDVIIGLFNDCPSIKKNDARFWDAYLVFLMGEMAYITGHSLEAGKKFIYAMNGLQSLEMELGFPNSIPRNFHKVVGRNREDALDPSSVSVGRYILLTNKDVIELDDELNLEKHLGMAEVLASNAKALYDQDGYKDIQQLVRILAGLADLCVSYSQEVALRIMKIAEQYSKNSYDQVPQKLRAYVKKSIDMLSSENASS